MPDFAPVDEDLDVVAERPVWLPDERADGGKSERHRFEERLYGGTGRESERYRLGAHNLTKGGVKGNIHCPLIVSGRLRRRVAPYQGCPYDLLTQLQRRGCL